MASVAADLEGRGFDVARFNDEAEAARHVRDSPPDLVVVNENDRDALDGTVLVLGSGSHETDAIRATQGAMSFAMERLLVSQPDEPHTGEALQRLASLGLVAASVAHEINSPLASLYMELGALKANLRGDWEAREALEGAIEAMERIRVVVNDVRELSRSADPLQAPACVHKVLDRSLRLLRPKLRGHVTVEKEYGRTPLVAVRDGRLGQLFINLISNAADALPRLALSRNVIRVVTSLGPEGECAVDVIDNGAGIAKDDLPHILEPFFTTKGAQGTGLGLALCHAILESIGGRMEVESQPGVGSRFRVLLPPHESHRMSDAPADDEAASTIAGQHVLILDEDQAFGRALVRALAPLSTATLVRDLDEAAARGIEADVFLCEAPTSALAFESLVERVELVRAALPRQIIYMSTDPSALHVASRFRVIGKPFDMRELGRLLDDASWS